MHPKFINLVCMKTSIKYLHEVTEIMDTINDSSQATGENFNDIKDDLIKQLKQKIKEQA